MCQHYKFNKRGMKVRDGESAQKDMFVHPELQDTHGGPLEVKV
jgi:hypothetical protein